jgi:hypothetical protein
VLDLAVLVQHGPAAGVEERIVLERDGGGLDCVERGTAGFEDLPACGGRRVEPGVVGRLVSDRAPGAPVDD